MKDLPMDITYLSSYTAPIVQIRTTSTPQRGATFMVETIGWYQISPANEYYAQLVVTGDGVRINAGFAASILLEEGIDNKDVYTATVYIS